MQGFLKVVLPCAFVMMAQSAIAGDEKPWYVGGDIGHSRYMLDTPSGYSPSAYGIRQDRDSTSFGIFGGYQVNPYVAVELGYSDLGEIELKRGTDRASATVKGISASALWQWPVAEQWKVYAKTGVMYARAETSVHTSNLTAHQTHSGAVPVLGVGAAYSLMPQWAVRVQYEDIGSTAVAKAVGKKARIEDEVYSLGVVYSF